MLFSEPKIPQSSFASLSLLPQIRFQCSSASRKFLNISVVQNVFTTTKVSVLFSEPKIPQSLNTIFGTDAIRGFSALQRAENSSMISVVQNVFTTTKVSVLFSEPKIPQFTLGLDVPHSLAGFSALQRAENSSIHSVMQIYPPPPAFQCSSASRKFLNGSHTFFRGGPPGRFSALQRAENSSIHHEPPGGHPRANVSVLFSEPKIPQCRRCARHHTRLKVSVLFSEPKIPQFRSENGVSRLTKRFSALQRAENSSILRRRRTRSRSTRAFQCSSASRKFLNSH